MKNMVGSSRELISPFFWAVSKKTYRGAPETLSYAAMIYSLFIRVAKRMPCRKTNILSLF
ncbi:hypothetical protein J14TS2_20840 [Bacillus sp. J14TS2]|nr:hypothetical protein J14TS2_20840 [Bacillus sp. J14TS2]